MSKQYIHTTIVHNMTAPREVVPIVLKFVKAASVLDVGCGTGTWLKAFAETGTTDYVGLDGDYVDRNMLEIPADKFLSHNLSKPFDLNRKFDLVVSLEVAEHLPESAADSFVDSLARHGDVILFSAAVPGQSGQGHQNEQWPEYWQKKFAAHGLFFHDRIRPEIWNNDKVDFWYRQNIFLIEKRKPSIAVLAMVHPRLLEFKVNNEREYQKSLAEGRQGLRIAISIFLNAIRFKVRNLLRLGR